MRVELRDATRGIVLSKTDLSLLATAWSRILTEMTAASKPQVQAENWKFCNRR